MSDTNANMTYADYLMLDQVLSAQAPKTDVHDEMLFVIIHQTAELWMKQMLFELRAAYGQISAGDLVPAYKGMARISRIQAILTQAWEILNTMTPADYLKFRHALGSSSGFQSYQFRLIEFWFGHKQPQHLKYHPKPAQQAALNEALNSPSLYDVALQALAKAGFDLPAHVLARDWATPYMPDAAVEAAWLHVYQNPETHWELYQLAEKLVDLDDALSHWRFRHMSAVERIIGRKPGTGGSDGVGYLGKTLATHCFPELWSLRTQL